MDKNELIEEMLKDMGDRNNTIDLNAYGRGLIDMYDKLVKNRSIPVVSKIFYVMVDNKVDNKKILSIHRTEKGANYRKKQWDDSQFDGVFTVHQIALED